MKTLLALAALVLTISASVLPKGNYPLTYAGGITTKPASFVLSDGQSSLEVLAEDCARLVYEMTPEDGEKFSLKSTETEYASGCRLADTIKQCFDTATEWVKHPDGKYSLKCGPDGISFVRLGKPTDTRRRHNLSH